jgi:hypothetical protein
MRMQQRRPQFQEVSDNMNQINALFVDEFGPYHFTRVEGVKAWHERIDARLCRNGWPAVAHPPCQRWGRYWSGGPSVKEKKLLGDDNGCFAFSLWYVRLFGGVIEHPEASHAFKFFGLPIPQRSGGWSEPDSYGGRSCCVEQGHYGHTARKATWLYAIKTDFPELRWGPCESKTRLDPGFHSREEARAARSAEGYTPIKRLTKEEMIFTPTEFRDLLIGIARTVK